MSVATYFHYPDQLFFPFSISIMSRQSFLYRDRPFFGFLTVMSRHHKFCCDKVSVQLLQVGVVTWNFMSLQHFCFGSCCSSNYVSQHETPCCHCLLQFLVATHFSCRNIEKSVATLFFYVQLISVSPPNLLCRNQISLLSRHHLSWPCLSIVTRVSSSFGVATYITLSRQRYFFKALILSQQAFPCYNNHCRDIRGFCRDKDFVLCSSLCCNINSFVATFFLFHLSRHVPMHMQCQCHCNFSCYMHDAHYMNHSHQLYFTSITMQTYKFHIFHANIYRYRIKHISNHQSMTKQIMSYNLP